METLTLITTKSGNDYINNYKKVETPILITTKKVETLTLITTKKWKHVINYKIKCRLDLDTKVLTRDI